MGRLGTLDLPCGWYTYAGSALGPGGLRARINRHRRLAKRPHWHIDYLLSRACLVASWELACPERLECAWQAAVLGLAGALLPVAGFGASDCACPGHLTFFHSRPPDATILSALSEASPVGARVHRTTYGACTGR
ncbi:MAG TPA: GIY-YIG nuclease family protein [Anaerolineae bacterium]|nr:GIY-YIG nuclease family protein [Anaerolineae bacterium]